MMQLWWKRHRWQTRMRYCIEPETRWIDAENDVTSGDVIQPCQTTSLPAAESESLHSNKPLMLNEADDKNKTMRRRPRSWPHSQYNICHSKTTNHWWKTGPKTRPRPRPWGESRGQGQKDEAEIEAIWSRPRPRPWGQSGGQGQKDEAEIEAIWSRPRPRHHTPTCERGRPKKTWRRTLQEAYDESTYHRGMRQRHWRLPMCLDANGSN